MIYRFRVIAVSRAKNRHSPQFPPRRSPGLASKTPESIGVPADAGLAQGRLSRRNWVAAGAGATLPLHFALHFASHFALRFALRFHSQERSRPQGQTPRPVGGGAWSGPIFCDAAADLVRPAI